MNPALFVLEDGLQPPGQSSLEIRLSFFKGLLITLNIYIEQSHLDYLIFFPLVE